MTYRCDNCDWRGDDPEFSMYSDDSICPNCGDMVRSDNDFEYDF
jgi:predicted RNA-binding Zn-ribbon protein involved in translation (DUF1610 family)